MQNRFEDQLAKSVNEMQIEKFKNLQKYLM